MAQREYGISASTWSSETTDMRIWMVFWFLFQVTASAIFAGNLGGDEWDGFSVAWMFFGIFAGAISTVPVLVFFVLGLRILRIHMNTEAEARLAHGEAEPAVDAS